MQFIIDTHIFLWALSEPERIDLARRREIESPANVVFLSAVSVTEIMIKKSLGNLDFPHDPLREAENLGLESLAFSVEDALPLGELPFHHRDPFDRMLIAQGQVRGMRIMTDDPKFRKYDCALL